MGDTPWYARPEVLSQKSVSLSLTRRHMMSAALAAMMSGSTMRSAAVAGTVVPVRVWPEARAAFALLSRRVKRISLGAVELTATAGSPPGATATFGGLTLATTSPGPVLELFAGFPYGMSPRELVLWIGSPEGCELWTGGFAALSLHAFPCRVLAMPGVVLTDRPILAVSGIAGVGISCREGSVSASAWGKLGAIPAHGVEDTVALAPSHGVAGAFGLGNGPARSARTFSPPFGALLELAFCRQHLVSLDPIAVEWISLACGIELAASLGDLDVWAAGVDAVPAPLSIEVLSALSCATAETLRESMPAAAAMGYAAARTRFAASLPLLGARGHVCGHRVIAAGP